MIGILFAEIAEAVKKLYGVRAHVNSNNKTITIFRNGECYELTITKKEFKGS
jgi:hypothetical protein